MKKYTCVAGVIFCATIIGITILQFDRDSGALKSDNKKIAAQTKQQNIQLSDGELLAGTADNSNAGISKSRTASADTTITVDADIVENTTEQNQPIVYDDVLNNLHGSTEQSKTLYAARENLVQQCMNELGFEYQVGLYVDDNSFVENVQPVNHGDVADAKNRGYGIFESISGAPDRAILGDSVDSVNSGDSSIAIDNENTVHLETLSEDERKAWNEALLGKFDSNDPSASGSMVTLVKPDASVVMWDTNSCISAANKTLYGSDIKYKENNIVKETLHNEYNEEIQNDPMFVGAVADWKNCMKAHELDYEYPGAAAGILYGQFMNGELSESELKEAEIKVSTIDALCYQEHELDEMLTSVEIRIGEDLLKEHASTIDGLRSSLLEAVITAEKFL